MAIPGLPSAAGPSSIRRSRQGSGLARRLSRRSRLPHGSQLRRAPGSCKPGAWATLGRGGSGMPGRRAESQAPHVRMRSLARGRRRGNRRTSADEVGPSSRHPVQGIRHTVDEAHGGRRRGPCGSTSRSGSICNSHRPAEQFRCWRPPLAPAAAKGRLAQALRCAVAVGSGGAGVSLRPRPARHRAPDSRRLPRTG
jgi:hypothetical protein